MVEGVFNKPSVGLRGAEEVVGVDSTRFEGPGPSFDAGAAIFDT